MKYEKRICALYIVLILCFSILVARLYNLSVTQNNKSLSVLDGQYTGKITACSKSGFIYDRNGRLISHRISGSLALVNPDECDEPLYYADRLSKCSLVSTASDIYEKLMSGIPFTIASDSSKAIALPGVYMFDTYEEDFSLAPHFMGYKNSDGDGVTGLRLHYSDYLYKENQAEVTALFDTNAKRQSLSPFNLEYEDYISSDGIVTTLDMDVQAFCDSLESDIVSGAVIVSKVETGEILAMSSFPSYDTSNLSQSLESDKGELINRALHSFTPGSVFKIITAISALEKDEALFDYTYTCTGTIETDNSLFRCHKSSGHGEISMADAFSQSCNTYFVSLAQEIGIDAICNTMKKFKLNQKTVCSFMTEADNFFIDEQSQRKSYLANISFGQGDLCLSPLDMAKIINTSVSTHLTEPICIKGLLSDGDLISEDLKESTRILKENTAEKLLIMMEKCVNEGTGKAAYADNEFYGGKTATAQTGTFDSDGVEKVNKWFCGVDNVKNPSISIVVLCDFTTNDELSPAVVFKKILEHIGKRHF